MPHPTQVVALLKAQNIIHVRLYDADRGMLVALANTGIQVVVSVPNDQILGIGQSNSTAANWVSRNVVAHYPATNITAICVGSDVLTTLPNAAKLLVNALKYIQSALVSSNLDREIKVSTPLSSSLILDPFPPSQAFFNKTWNPVLVPMLNFLQSTDSYLMLNVYPYYDYVQSDGAIPLDYALFKPLPPNQEAVDSNTLVHYSNVFDATGKTCYEPDNVIAHATYAFDTYYHQMGKAPEACNFNGVAAITTTDPKSTEIGFTDNAGHGTCVFPGRLRRLSQIAAREIDLFVVHGSLGRNGTLVNITAPSLNSSISASHGYKINGSGGALMSILTVIRLVIWGVIFL
ncbi:hypothetical protein JRO89_XS11G0026800 [Xanthoceras sorbifolium]|uniref:glucan endo-1,3-beta-D-glucosidase n=1 Tax=Xanthoceras sorbifolium TaxID=99658 RepID=A0ABQ8HEE5_9ROSI|nr:hypothetical protein JRO89_XS11G0026800 [Xanthoceras sorbifolium]